MKRNVANSVFRCDATRRHAQTGLRWRGSFVTHVPKELVESNRIESSRIHSSINTNTNTNTNSRIVLRLSILMARTTKHHMNEFNFMVEYTLTHTHTLTQTLTQTLTHRAPA
mmetsp:Transcript_22102/g.61488  ORF Transcript_22102/g.61488 Transcript_22102/m.61488 type:complete len:112 (-) Transcript_22102:36-371(-)